MFRALKSWGSATTVASNILLAFGIVLGLGAIWQWVPWWVPVSVFLLLFLYGLLVESYEAFQNIKKEKEELAEKKKELEEELEERQKRMALRDLLGAAYEQGRGVTWAKTSRNEGRKQWLDHADKRWVDNTYNLIEAAFGKHLAEQFKNNMGIDFEKVMGFPLPKQQYDFFEDEYWVDARLWRLSELIERLHSLDIRPDFDPEDWQPLFAQTS